MKRKLQPEYNSLENIKQFLMTKTSMDCSIQQDQWFDDGQVMLTARKQCIVIKESGTAGAKVVLKENNIVDIRPIAPSTYINTLTQRGIVAMLIHAIISGSQNKVANEVENYLLEIQNN
ncbi:hypothetical protein [Aureibaculum luteum]|uniref:hypothetical protein n=1 Tax=Aureibaculum luteum TaxID=1548456 RepID=UPI000E4A1B3F|nr:hypothetical protein [Aureibaculum luteum]